MQQAVRASLQVATDIPAHFRWASNAARNGRDGSLDSPASFYFYRFLPILDIAIGMATLGVVAMVSQSQSEKEFSLAGFLATRVTLKNVALLMTFVATWTAIALRNDMASSTRRVGLLPEAVRVAALYTLGSAPGLLFVLTSVRGGFRLRELAAFWVAVIPLLCLARLALRVAGKVAAPWLSPLRKCIVLGSGERAFMLGESLAGRADVRYEILGFVDSPGYYTHPEIAQSGLLGTTDRLSDILKNCVVDELLVALPVKSCYSEIQSAIRTCEEAGVRCKIPSDSFSYSIARARVGADHPVPVITLDVVKQGDALVVKRAMDIAGAVFGLIVLGPILSLIAVLIRLDSPGPVFFRQQRYGLNKRIFTIWKFRTMFQDAEVRQAELEAWNEMRGPVFKIRNDPRITRLGRLLRRTSLDELPQLWNVLTGAMSLVGPRPLPVRDVSKFEDAWLMRRFSVKPGITCLWQISGRNDVGFDRWIELDLQYIDNWSLRLDVEILLRTVKAVVLGEGAA